jgi:hypothetical protein
MAEKLSIKALALSLGIGWALWLFVLALFAAAGWGTEAVGVIGTIYPGYAASGLGAILGLIWGFIDGFICGAIIAWLYNKFV